MNIKFQRAVDRYAGVPICALLSLLDLFRRKAKITAPPRRILVILLSEMGSLVLAHPMFAALRARYPDASLHVMLFGKTPEQMVREWPMWDGNAKADLIIAARDMSR